MPGRKHIVFDVLGTCVSFDAYVTRIEAAIGTELSSHKITAQSFAFTWRTAAELEFTFLSVSEHYKPFLTVLEAVFYRTLMMMGISKPRELATDEQRDQCVQGYSELALRPELAACFEKLRAANFTVWCLTTGDVTRVREYFVRGGVDMPKENFISCDTKGIAKPALESYRPALDQFANEDEKWFAAAHMWDVSAAKRAGFKGAYCTVYERDPCPDIYDEPMDVVADSLAEMAEKIVVAAS